MVHVHYLYGVVGLTLCCNPISTVPGYLQEGYKGAPRGNHPGPSTSPSRASQTAAGSPKIRWRATPRFTLARAYGNPSDPSTLSLAALPSLDPCLDSFSPFSADCSVVPFTVLPVTNGVRATLRTSRASYTYLNTPFTLSRPRVRHYTSQEAGSGSVTPRPEPHKQASCHNVALQL